MVDTEDDDGRNSPPPDEGPKESSGAPSKSGKVEIDVVAFSNVGLTNSELYQDVCKFLHRSFGD